MRTVIDWLIWAILLGLLTWGIHASIAPLLFGAEPPLVIDLSKKEDVQHYMDLLGWRKVREADTEAQRQCAYRMVLERGAHPGSVTTLGWYFIPLLGAEVSICSSDAPLLPGQAEQVCRGIGYKHGASSGPAFTCWQEGA